ncbi:hypothetical protein ACKFKF_08750 [Phormidesmis sp. 146-12]
MLKIHSERKCRWAVLVSSAMIGGAIVSMPAQAQSPPMFQNATLSPKFSPDPTELKGITGGSVAAKEVAGRADSPTGGCLGFMDAAPNHTIELKAAFKYLKIQTQSSEDTTIVIKGPGGVWCNDDLQDKNAGIEGEWLPGSYQVWVGTYHKDKATPYILRITEVR